MGKTAETIQEFIKRWVTINFVLINFTQPIKATQLFKQSDLSNRQNGRLLLMLFSTNFMAKWRLIFVLTQENNYL